MKSKIIERSIGLEHPSVQSVIKIAEGILSKNKVLNIENLYNLAKRSLNIPRNGLLSIIQFLINKKILIEGSKFSKETLLLNQFRSNIYKYIRRNRGAHFSNIKKSVIPDNKGSRGGSGQLIWHLEMLIKFKYIKKIKVGNYTIFLPIEMDEELGIINFLLRDELNEKIIDLINRKGKIKRSEIYKQLNEKRENVYYRLNYLVDHNILSLAEEPDRGIYINRDKKEFIDIMLKEMHKIY